MKVVRSIKSIQQLLKKERLKNKSIGFVPTMGNLHEGHASLLRKCRKENDICVLSIFANPTQFGPKEDFRRYPRTFKKDKLLAKKEKVDIIFYPSVEEIYPRGFLTAIHVEKLDEYLCGKSRPGHFKGVATVVGKLLNIVGCNNMYLGAKDGQQSVILKKMVADLDFPVRIISCPTVREKDGLALSSRNQYLNARERYQASALYQSLKDAKAQVLKGERRAEKIIAGISGTIKKQTSGIIDYVECVDTQTLAPVKILKSSIMIALAIKFGKARLIDNIVVKVR